MCGRMHGAFHNIGLQGCLIEFGSMNSMCLNCFVRGREQLKLRMGSPCFYNFFRFHLNCTVSLFCAGIHADFFYKLTHDNTFYTIKHLQYSRVLRQSQAIRLQTQILFFLPWMSAHHFVLTVRSLLICLYQRALLWAPRNRFSLKQKLFAKCLIFDFERDSIL